MNKINYTIIDHIKCYHPDVAFSNEGFPEKKFQIFEELSKKNFWYKSRSRLITQLIMKYCSDKNNFLEVGCGIGFNLQYLNKFFNNKFKLIGSDIYLDCLKILSNKINNIELIQMDINLMEIKEEYDIIGAFDVIEHITDDYRAIKNIYNALRKKGFFFITVPQHKCLWSSLDYFNNHKRRYSRKELILKLEKAGFDVVFVSSYVFFLFPIMFISRLLKKNQKISKNLSDANLLDLKLPNILNIFFSIFMRIEEYLIRLSIPLPFGGSLIVVAKKT